MKQRGYSDKVKAKESILDFISGKTNTSAAKRLTEYWLFTKSLTFS